MTQYLKRYSYSIIDELMELFSGLGEQKNISHRIWKGDRKCKNQYRLVHDIDIAENINLFIDTYLDMDIGKWHFKLYSRDIKKLEEYLVNLATNKAEYKEIIGKQDMTNKRDGDILYQYAKCMDIFMGENVPACNEKEEGFHVIVDLINKKEEDRNILRERIQHAIEQIKKL